MYDTIEQNYIIFESNVINILIDSDEITWFKSIDIAKSLGYIDIKDAIRTHINSDNKKYLSEIKVNIKGHPSTIYINEAGLYELLLKSKLKKALKFKKWVTSDVLPSIRKFGIYKLKKKDDELILELKAKLTY